MKKQELLEIAEVIAETVVKVLERKKLVGKGGKSDRTAYQKTESLLYNYCGFKKIVQQRMQEIEDLKKYGVPQRSVDIVKYSPSSGTVQGTVLPEESVEKAVQRVEESIVDTVQAIDLVDKGMVALKNDPYYKVLEMRYFEGRSQEDIAMVFNCSQATISNNQSRLVRELSMKIFPDQTVKELLE